MTPGCPRWPTHRCRRTLTLCKSAWPAGWSGFINAAPAWSYRFCRNFTGQWHRQSVCPAGWLQSQSLALCCPAGTWWRTQQRAEPSAASAGWVGASCSSTTQQHCCHASTEPCNNRTKVSCIMCSFRTFDQAWQTRYLACVSTYQ